MSSHTSAALAPTSARAAASRADGAKSRGPRTAAGKARSAQNALKHGLSARKHVLLPDDSRAEFKALEGALLEELCPEGALQTLLVHRLVAAAWRLARADRLEFRDGRVAGVFATLVRYRGGAQAEFFRTLKALRALQAEAARDEAELRPNRPESAANGARNEPDARAIGHKSATKATRNEPERRPQPSAGFPGRFSPQSLPAANGRDGGSRTRTARRPSDFKSDASTGSATSPEHDAVSLMPQAR
jgi:hypothetical protein